MNAVSVLNNMIIYFFINAIIYYLYKTYRKKCRYLVEA